MADESVNAGIPDERSGPTDTQVALSNLWPTVSEEVANLQTDDLKNQGLPQARIKRIMKLDAEAKMISAEAPLMFAKAAEIFIRELSLRAWINTEGDKRRTLQKSDISVAVSQDDQFDFLVDVVPSVKPTQQERRYVQFPEETPAGVFQQVQVQAQMAGQQQPQAVSSSQPTVSSGQQQVPLQQVYLQVPAPNGEMQTVPIYLTVAQLEVIGVQMENMQPGHPIVLQTIPDSVPTAEPTAQVPTAQVPTAQVPTAQVPTAQVPTAQVPTAQVPTAQVPTAQVPTAQVPTAQVPTAEPTAEVPTAEVPTAEVQQSSTSISQQADQGHVKQEDTQKIP